MKNNPFNIPNLTPMYVAVKNYVRLCQGKEKCFILTENQSADGKTATSGDTIWGFIYLESESRGVEMQVKAVRVDSFDTLQVIMDLPNVIYDDDAVRQAEDNNQSVLGSWCNLKDDDFVYYIPTLFNIAECIHEYTDEKNMLSVFKDCLDKTRRFDGTVILWTGIGGRLDLEFSDTGNLPWADMHVIAKEFVRKASETDPDKRCTEILDELVLLLTGTPEHKQELIDRYDLQTCRVCSRCGSLMHQGYVVDDGNLYFCRDLCFREVYGKKEMEEMLKEADSDNARAYWTVWEG